MSLDWSVEKCVGRENWSERDYEVLDKLIWGSCTVGLNEITEDNIPEWRLRMRMERARCPYAFEMKYVQYPVSRYFIGLFHLTMFIGLKTNATALTRSKWLKELMERVVRCEEDTFEWEKREMAKALTKVGE